MTAPNQPKPTQEQDDWATEVSLALREEAESGAMQGTLWTRIAEELRAAEVRGLEAALAAVRGEYLEDPQTTGDEAYQDDGDGLFISHDHRCDEMVASVTAAIEEARRETEGRIRRVMRLQAGDPVDGKTLRTPGWSNGIIGWWLVEGGFMSLPNIAAALDGAARRALEGDEPRDARPLCADCGDTWGTGVHDYQHPYRPVPPAPAVTEMCTCSGWLGDGAVTARGACPVHAKPTGGTP